MQVVAGVDLGGTAINYTLIDTGERFLIEELFDRLTGGALTAPFTGARDARE